MEAGAQTIELVLRKLELDPKDFIALSRMAATYASMGDNKKALDTVQKVMNIDHDDSITFYNCAETYAVLGRKKDALALLKKSFDYGFYHLMDWTKGDPHFESIRNDPEFQEILSKYCV